MMIQVVITLSDDGQLTITGPIQNKVLTYGILERAKDVVRAQPLKAPDIIVPVRQMPDNGHLRD
jgi:hypothetical protein